MTERTISTPEGDFTIDGKVRHVDVTFGSQEPPTLEGDEDGGEAILTRKTFEDALDKVSTPLRGRLAHVPYSSEDFIKEKREEAELEDRPS
jgi:hypothetical protein